MFEDSPKSPRARIFRAAKLLDEPQGSKERNPLGTLRRKAPIGEPNKEIENGRRCCQDFDGLNVRGNRMGGDFTVEIIAKDNYVGEIFR
jgi:hypothetical protein